MNIDRGEVVRSASIQVFIPFLLSCALGCGGSGEVTARPSGEPNPSAQKPTTSPSDRDSSKSKGGQSAAGTLLLSGSDLSGEGLYLLSPGAREALPVRLSSFQTQFFDPVAVGLSGVIAAIGYEKFGSGYSLQLIQPRTGRNYVLYTAQAGSKLADPSSSPDGKWIAFTEENADRKTSTIKLIEVETERLTALAGADSRVRSLARDSHPRFTSSGKDITFERRTSSGSFIMLGSMESASEPSVLLSGTVSQNLRAFQYAPHSGAFLYLRSFGKNARLILKQGDTPETPISSETENVHEPSWSPDGKRILYWAESRSSQNIQIYDLAHGLVRILAPINAPSTASPRVCPVWSPEMHEVYYASSAGQWDAIFKVALSGGGITKLTDSNLPPSFYCPRVLPSDEVKRP